MRGQQRRYVPFDPHRRTPFLEVRKRLPGGCPIVFRRRTTVPCELLYRLLCPGAVDLLERGVYGGRGRYRIRDARVHPARTKRREEVSGFPNQQDSLVLIGEIAGEYLEELIGRDPGDAVSVHGGHHLWEPAAHALHPTEPLRVVLDRK